LSEDKAYSLVVCSLVLGAMYSFCVNVMECVDKTCLTVSGINKIVDRHVGLDTDPLSLIHAQRVYELVMVRDGIFSLSDQNSTNADILVAIESLCTN